MLSCCFSISVTASSRTSMATFLLLLCPIVSRFTTPHDVYQHTGGDHYGKKHTTVFACEHALEGCTVPVVPGTPSSPRGITDEELPICTEVLITGNARVAGKYTLVTTDAEEPVVPATTPAPAICQQECTMYAGRCRTEARGAVICGDPDELGKCLPSDVLCPIPAVTRVADDNGQSYSRPSCRKMSFLVNALSTRLKPLRAYTSHNQIRRVVLAETRASVKSSPMDRYRDRPDGR